MRLLDCCKSLELKWYAWQGSNLRPSVPEFRAVIRKSLQKPAKLLILVA
jgi:hypothetical protein